MHDFITQKPTNSFLSSLVDYYFFIDTPIDTLSTSEEYVLPFPRITFGYFFEYPFLVTNHDLKQSQQLDMGISRISTQKITVFPLTERIKIIGAHTKPYILAYLTNKSVSTLPWLINTRELLREPAIAFEEKVKRCDQVENMFLAVEEIFLQTIQAKDLSVISRAVNVIEKHKGNIRLADLSDQLQLSDRALRNQFNQHVGCTPKDFIRLVQLIGSVEQIKTTKASLTEISQNTHYFDQAHFIHAFKKVTGKSPKNLRKEMTHFRFLQF